MAKLPANWASRDGNSTATQTSGALLLENGSYLLLENGSHLLLESITMTPKEQSLWDPSTKASSAWSAKDGNSIITLANAGGIRVKQNGTDIRVLQNGTDVRILNESVVTPKYPSQWDSL